MQDPILQTILGLKAQSVLATDAELTAWRGGGLTAPTPTVDIALLAATKADLVFSAAPTFDFSLGYAINLAAITEAITAITLANVPQLGQIVCVNLLQDGTGGWAITWPADVIFPTAWSNTGNTANKKCTVAFVSDGTNLICLGANKWH